MYSTLPQSNSTIYISKKHSWFYMELYLKNINFILSCSLLKCLMVWNLSMIPNFLPQHTSGPCFQGPVITIENEPRPPIFTLPLHLARSVSSQLRTWCVVSGDSWTILGSWMAGVSLKTPVIIDLIFSTTLCQQVAVFYTSSREPGEEVTAQIVWRQKLD